eukprot:2679631-Alexandrium_andersonii.AAC.1
MPQAPVRSCEKITRAMLPPPKRTWGEVALMWRGGQGPTGRSRPPIARPSSGPRAGRRAGSRHCGGPSASWRRWGRADRPDRGRSRRPTER